MIVCFMDDLLVKKKVENIQQRKEKLGFNFILKDLRKFTSVLGIWFPWLNNWVFYDQIRTTEKRFVDSGRLAPKLGKSLLAASVQNFNGEDELLTGDDRRTYYIIVVSLLYHTIKTQPT